MTRPDHSTHRSGRRIGLVLGLGVLVGASVASIAYEIWGPTESSTTEEAAVPGILLPVRNAAGLWGYMNTLGQIEIPFRFRSVRPFSENLAAAQEHEDWGYIDRSGDYAIPPHYFAVRSFAEGRAAVWIETPQGIKAGHIDRTGAYVVKPRYDSVSSFENGFASARLESLWGYIDRSGEFAISPRFRSARSFVEGMAAVELALGPTDVTQWDFVTPEGKAVNRTDQQFQSVRDFSDGLAVVQCADDKSFGYLNRRGELVVPCRFGYVCDSINGVALGFSPPGSGGCFWPRDERSAFVHLVSEKPLPGDFDRLILREGADFSTLSSVASRIEGPMLGVRLTELRPFALGLSIVVNEKGESAVINQHARLVIPFRKRRLEDISEGVVRFSVKSATCDTRFGALDLKGRVIIPPDWGYLGPFSDGLAPACEVIEPGESIANGTWCAGAKRRCGFLDKSGDVVFWLESDALDEVHPENLGDLLRPFKHGLAAVRGTGAEGRSSMGYIDRQGNWVIPPRFHAAGDFAAEGMAPVQVHSSSKTLARDGREVPENVPLRTSGGLAIHEHVVSLVPGQEVVRYGFKNGQGKVVIPPRFDSVKEFSEGVAAVAMHRKETQKTEWGFIDRSGKYVISPRFDDVLGSGFANGLVAVRKNGKVGFIDKTGHFIVPPRFDEVAPEFKNGRAKARVGKKVGFITRSGTWAVPLDYEDARAFQEGLAAVKKAGRWGFVDPHGNEVVKPVFMDVGDFSEGLAPVLASFDQRIEASQSVLLCEDLVPMAPESEVGRVRGAFEIVRRSKTKLCLEFASSRVPSETDGSRLRWGYVNLRGMLAIAPELPSTRGETPGSFEHGVACVHLDERGEPERQGYIDRTGKVLFTSPGFECDSSSW